MAMGTGTGAGAGMETNTRVIHLSWVTKNFDAA